MSKFDKHIFVCTNLRPEDHPKGSCGQKGGEQLLQSLRRNLRKRGIRSMRANSAGCLDACSQGCAVVVYPDAVWYGDVTLDDIEEIVDSHLVNGNPVERLQIFKDEEKDAGKAGEG